MNIAILILKVSAPQMPKYILISNYKWKIFHRSSKFSTFYSDYSLQLGRHITNMTMSEATTIYRNQAKAPEIYNIHKAYT
jgi:hypothetical protein